MIKKYDKDKEFYREIEVAWNKYDKRYEITKRNISGGSSQGQSMQFSKQEVAYLEEILNKISISERIK